MSDKPHSLKPRTIAAQALGAIEPATRAVALPVHVSTTYIRDPDNQYRTGYIYGRPDNATVRQTEAVIAALEGAHEAHAVRLRHGGGDQRGARAAAGRARARAAGLLLGLSRLADATRRRCSATRSTSSTSPISRGPRRDEAGHQAGLDRDARQSALEHHRHRGGRRDRARGRRRARHRFDRRDAGVHPAARARRRHRDAFGDEISQRPFRRDRRRARDRARRRALDAHQARCAAHHGAILGPFEAWLLLRGLRTLDVRVRAQAESAALLAQRFANHAAVSRVLYPGLPSHPGHAVAVKQMSGFGGMLSIRVKAGERAAIDAAARVELWKRATSLGGVESLIEHRASIEGAGLALPARPAAAFGRAGRRRRSLQRSRPRAAGRQR